MGWTRQQEQAINLNNTNLLVSAAAGSGKTAVLTERIVNKVSTETDIDRMLIITFTKAAAAEMRERISNAIADRLEKGEGNVQRLMEQQALMSKASICTIDSFCKQVVMKNFTISGVDSSFAVGDEEELELIRQEIFDEMLEEYYLEENPYFEILADYFSNKSSDIYLRDAIYNIHKFIYSMPDPMEWLRKAVDMYSCDNSEDFKNTSWYKEIINYAITIAENCKIEAEKAYNLSMNFSAPSVTDVLYSDLSGYEKLYNFISSDNRDWDEISGYINEYTFERRSKKPGDNPDDVKYMDKFRSEIKDNITKLKKIFNITSEEALNQIKQLRPCMEMVYCLIEDFDKRYSEIKKEKQILSFNDIEHLALKVLRIPEVASEYRKFYSEIYIDEYQDTNMLQEAIVSSFSRENNVFMVGDVKQSIYAFRQACPDLFIEKENIYSKPENTVKDSEGCLVKLSANFRSRKQVVNAVNNIFCKIMNKNTCGIDYSLEDQLNYKADYYDKSDNIADYKSEILVCQGNLEDEFHMIAKKINQLVQEGTPVYDKATENVRPVKYSDIAVLSRKVGKNAPTMIKVLQSHGIPCYAEEKGGFYEDFDVNVILSIVRIIDNPLQDIPLLTVLRSPIFNFSENDMAEIRINDKKSSLYDSMLTMDNKKVLDFLKRYEELKNKARNMSISAFIWMVITETGYYDYVGSSVTGSKRQANLRLLFDRAVAFENSGKRSFFRFINHIEKIQKQESSSELASVTTEGMDAVKVMTVHKSKGLEYPVVFVSKCSDKLHGKGFNTPSFDLNRIMGISMKKYNQEKDIFEDSFIRKAMSVYENRTEVAEEMRILYVAMTRAREKLYITGTVKDIETFIIKGEKPSDFNVINGKNYLSWIEQAADSLHWNVYTETEQEVILETEEYDGSASEYAPLIESEHKNVEKWVYPYIDNNTLPSKMSVSDIKKRNLDEDVFDYNREDTSVNLFKDFSFSSRKEFSGAEIGTLLHECLRRVDYDKCVDALINTENAMKKLKEVFIELMDEMIDKGFILPEEKELINPELPAGFFISSIGRRVLKSRNVRREVPFTILKEAESIEKGNTGKVTIQGIIDCCFMEDNEYVIVDYKSDNVYGDNIAERARSYKTQLDLYAEALSSITGIKVKEKVLFFLRPAVEIKV